MFIGIELLNSRTGIDQTVCRCYIVSDTEFVKNVEATDLLDAFRKVYEGHVENYPLYLMKFIVWWEKIYGHSNMLSYLSEIGSESDSRDWLEHIDKYKDELDKWLMLR